MKVIPSILLLVALYLRDLIDGSDFLLLFFLLLEEWYTARMDESLMNCLAFHTMQLKTYFEKHVSPYVEDFSIYGTHGISLSRELQVMKIVED